MKNIILFLLTTVLYSLCFDPWNLGWLAWLALCPGLVALSKMTSPTRAFGLGYMCGFLFFAASLSWLFLLFQWFSLVLFGILALFPAIFCYLMVGLRETFPRRIWFLMAPVIWTGIDYFRSEVWILKFSWMSLGYTQVVHLPIAQWASVVGVYGVTFLLTLSASLLALAWTDSRPMRLKVFAFVPACVLALLLWIGGHALKPAIRTTPGCIVTLQQNESSFLPEYCAMPVDADAKLVVWPEYSTFQPLVPGQKPFMELQQYAANRRITLVATGPLPLNGQKFKNTSYVIGPDGVLLGQYHKANPVPFINDGIRGTGNKPITTPLGKMGLAICYDMDFESVIRTQTTLGAEYIVIPTYDSREWSWRQHRQHSAMTSIRAIENRRWILRAASSGITQIVAPDGQITASFDTPGAGSLTGAFGIEKSLTIHHRIGWTFPLLCCVTTLVLMLKVAWNELRKRRVTR